VHSSYPGIRTNGYKPDGTLFDMNQERCVHDMIPSYCADCLPTPDGLPDFVTVVPHGRLFHRTEECRVFVDARRDKQHLSTPTRVRPLSALAEGYERCWACL
jgi:hypothetical protein